MMRAVAAELNFSLATYFGVRNLDTRETGVARRGAESK